MDTRSTTTSAAAAAATAAPPSPAPATGDANLVVRIKKEPTSSSDEMKEFAETAMNELLGWYGYDGGGEDEDGADESDAPLRTRSIGDSSGPECSDSGGGGGGGGGGSSGPGGPWCGWCSRPMTDGAQATGAFCSELCFSQSRRASFKRNRMCDWCRHVRHTVAHVDVRDGARHLQFCGDKCLNQYKMHIFCRETRAHLELHPHPHPAGHPSASGIIGDAALITPDLWLRDCKDESSSDRQASSMSPRQPQPASHESNTGVPPRKRHCTANRRSLGSVNRRTRTSTVTSYHEPTAEVPQDLRVRPRSPTEAAAANESAAPKTPSVEQPRHWPLAPPPVTVLVPYPVIIPVPVPLPLPIPIPVPEEILKRAAANSSSATTTTSTTSSTTTTPIVTAKTTTTTTTTTKVETPEKQTDVQSAPVELTTTPSVRTLRKRKRPVGKEGSGRDQQTTRRTVPA